MQQAEPLLPVTKQNRIATLDITRGIALLGILMVNMQLFSSPQLYTGILETNWWTGPWDRAAGYFITVIAEGKFYPVFSFLFGCGFFIFMQKAGEKGQPVTALYLRRISLLFLFGVLHIVLLWWGDILHIYAVLGLLLLFFRHLSNAKLLLWPALLLLIPVIIVTLLFFAVTGNPDLQAGGSLKQYTGQMINSSLEAYSDGSFTEIYQQRMTDFIFSAQSTFFSGPQVLAMFLLGMYAARRGLMQNAKQHRHLLKQVWLYSLPPGALFTLLQVTGKYKLLSGPYMINDVFYFAGTTIGGTALSLFYISTIVLLLDKKKPGPQIIPPGPGRENGADQLPATVRYLYHHLLQLRPGTVWESRPGPGYPINLDYIRRAGYL